MKANEENFMTLISKQVQFRIPVYQRLYSWEQWHCETFLDDIIILLENPSIQTHFLGSVVYIERNETTITGTKELLVIDGQQRLTTFTLICIALEHLAKLHNNQNLVEQIRDTCLINKYSKLEYKGKLVLTKGDDVILKQLVDVGRDNIKKNSNRLIVNYDSIMSYIERVSEKHALDDIYDNLNRLMVVDVALFRNYDNPQQIFESLNATGKALEDGDLIRNFLLMNLPEEKQNEIYKNYWFPMETILGNDLTNFFYHFLYMEGGTSTNISDLYREFKIYFYNNYSHKNVDLIANKLLQYSQYYNYALCNFESVEETDDDFLIKNSLISLKKLGFDSHLPLLLAIIKENQFEHKDYKEQGKNGKLSNRDTVDIIQAIEAFLFRRSICEIPTNSLNSIFRTLWPKIDKENIKISLIDKLKSGEWNKRFPEDNEFKERLINNTLYRKRYCKLLFEEIEKQINKEANIDFSAFQIEHILPQTNGDADNLSENWKKMLGENYKELRDNWVHKLGNLTLTGYNQEYYDYDFEKKKTLIDRNGQKVGYFYSSAKITRAVADYETWNENSILDRSQRLAKEALKRWKYPLS